MRRQATAFNLTCMRPLISHSAWLKGEVIWKGCCWGVDMYLSVLFHRQESYWSSISLTLTGLCLPNAVYISVLEANNLVWAGNNCRAL